MDMWSNSNGIKILEIIDKINKDKSMKDFLIQDQSIHSIPKLINLYG